MITYAVKKDLADIKALWKECFSDSDEYIDFFFSEHCLEKETLVFKEECKVVGMLNLLPATMKTADGYIPVRYVYAVGTLKAFRGRGIASKLLSFANKELGEQGVATILVPASEALFQYYQKQGYHTAFYMKEQQTELSDLSSIVTAASINEDEIVKEDKTEKDNIEKDNIEKDNIEKDKIEIDKIDKDMNIAFENITPLEYKKLRDEHFEKLGYINWGIDEIEYAIKENELLGGVTKKILIGDKKYIIMYYIQEETLVIKESSLSDSKIPIVFQALAKQLKYNQVKLRSSKNHLKEGTLRPFGMIYENTKIKDLIHKNLVQGYQEAYINLVLD